MVTFDEFKKLDIKTAKVLKVEDHPNAEKLYLITADLGLDAEGKPIQKTFVAGIKKYYTKEELIGKSLVVINNLEPAVIRGVVSEAMLLAASNSDKSNLCIVTLDKPMQAGSRVG